MEHFIQGRRSIHHLSETNFIYFFKPDSFIERVLLDTCNKTDLFSGLFPGAEKASQI